MGEPDLLVFDRAHLLHCVLSVAKFVKFLQARLVTRANSWVFPVSKLVWIFEAKERSVADNLLVWPCSVDFLAVVAFLRLVNAILKALSLNQVRRAVRYDAFERCCRCEKKRDKFTLH